MFSICTDLIKNHVYFSCQDQNFEQLLIAFFLLDGSTNDVANGNYPISMSCTCSTPGEGTIDKNEFKCTNGETRHCSSDQECYAAEAFTYGEWGEGCRVSCECSTPGTGTVGQNEIKCSNGETRHCASEEECYATDKFTHGEWDDGCRIPGD